jgi:hypothetical protein
MVDVPSFFPLLSLRNIIIHLDKISKQLTTNHTGMCSERISADRKFGWAVFSAFPCRLEVNPKYCRSESPPMSPGVHKLWRSPRREPKIGTKILKMGTKIIRIGTKITKFGTKIFKVGTRSVKIYPLKKELSQREMSH